MNEAVKLLTNAWGTGTLAIPTDMEAPNMRLVGLPPIPGHEVPDDKKKASLSIMSTFEI